MARIVIVTPARPGTRTGNLHTATRWARMLRPCFEVRTMQAWDGTPCDLLIALHARRSHSSILQWKADSRGALVVVLTGTDLYKDLPGSAEAKRSLALADGVVVLQEAALQELPASVRKKTAVVYQSSDTQLRQAPPRAPFRVAVVGHLRAEKDPFRAAHALAALPGLPIEVVQVGGALDGAHEREARAWTRREPRYRWVGSVPHASALRWIARSHVLVVSSRMEGGANVIAEAARIGTPVLASRMSGNLGMLGAAYPGYFPLGDDNALASLILECIEGEALASLRAMLRKRRALFAPAAERRALLEVVRRASRSRGSA